MSLLTIGTWDVPHMGHAYFLGQCALLDKDVIVGVNSDKFVERYKGKRPIYGQDERVDVMRAMGYRVELNDGPGWQLILATKPDILAVGMDWFGSDKSYENQIMFQREDFEKWNIKLVFIPNRIMSTTSIKERLSEQETHSR